jgi:two-component system chemotaxis sensor kinase CheA
MTIDMSQFFQVFFEEAEEGLAEMEKLLLSVDVSNPDPEVLNAIFRCAHSIKGGAATFGLADLTGVTHVLESLLDRLRKGDMPLSTKHVDAFLWAKDVLKAMVEGHRHGTAVDQDAVVEMRKMLEGMSASANVAAAASKSAAASTTNAASAAAGVMRHVRIELPALSATDGNALEQEMSTLGAISHTREEDGRWIFMLDTVSHADDIIAICSFIVDAAEIKISQAAMGDFKSTEEKQGFGFFAPFVPLNATDEERGYGFFEPFVPFEVEAPKPDAADPHDLQVTEIHAAAAAHVEGDKKGKRESEKSGANTENSSIRVSIEKVDQLINLVGELVITQAMIEQRTDLLEPMSNERLINSVSQLTRNTRDLQEAVMSIRMMPMDYVFSRFPRMVRDLAAKLEKKVEFVTHGAATELDKSLIERIVDPLTHLVRNSLDHGIERPDARLAEGKSETGRLSLSAEHQGGNIIIEVTDDGGGLRRDKILDKARQQGLQVSDSMPDSDVWQLIFAPGFSTAEEVTDVSGRGVGMDVVKRNITAMGGAVDIRSSKGFGTTISISLPLTLAILDGMSIRIGTEIYILPLGYVVESLQPAAADVKDISGQGRVIKVRGEYLPLIALYQIFHIEPTYTDPSQGLVVILESNGKKAGLFVDDLVGQQQIVVKNLESNYRKVSGISGATILGDGGVALIIDVAALLRSSRQTNDESVYC